MAVQTKTNETQKNAAASQKHAEVFKFSLDETLWFPQASLGNIFWPKKQRFYFLDIITCQGVVGLLVLWLALTFWLTQTVDVKADGPAPSITATTGLTTTGSNSVCGDAPAQPDTPPAWLGETLKAGSSLATALRADDPFAGRVNILLMGSDDRPGEKFGRTDSMILVTIDPISQTAAMLSLPRDLWVSIPGYGENRLNMAHRLGGVKKHPGGGAALAVETVESNLGVPVDFYAVVNFESFQQIVDTLGGIDLCAPETIDAAAYYGYTAESVNPAEFYSYVPAPPDDSAAAKTDDSTVAKGYKFLYIEAGWHTLNGEAALSYARSRASVTADFARVRRQQAVLLALKDKIIRSGLLLKLPELWPALSGLVETNLQLPDLLQLAALAYTLDPANLQLRAISHEQTIGYKTASGAQVLLPRRAEIQALVTELFGDSQPTAALTQPELELAGTAASTPPEPSIALAQN